jgi:hypothetical protein
MSSPHYYALVLYCMSIPHYLLVLYCMSVPHYYAYNIPRGSVIQLVPHLFGFEERRFSFGPETLDNPGQDAATVHMDSHWGVSKADAADKR